MDFKRCSRCVCDASVPGIVFDARGECSYCKLHDLLDRSFPSGREGARRLERIVERAKRDGKGRDYDCVVGVSGGRDSTYLLLQTVKMGLRPLAVHYDNGWNSEIAVANIKSASSKLKADLFTYVNDWEEFKDLQKSFLRASVPDAEMPTDIGLKGALFRAAAAHGVKHVFTGYSFRTEGVTPATWNYMDGKYVESVHKAFGKLALKSFPNVTLPNFLYYSLARGIKFSYMMPFMDYSHSDAGALLERECGWRPYGGHHHENLYTKFILSWYLPEKFGIDERKTEFSAKIRSGQMSREEALKALETPAQESCGRETVDYVLKKLELSKAEFDAIMAAPKRTFLDYRTYWPLIKASLGPIKLGHSLGLLPDLFLFIHCKFSPLLELEGA